MGWSMTISGERRKTVTVLFADMVGSTALGESLDPEPLRQLMVRYFEQMAGAVRRHGGTVEKFIGDAVMAVFGVPRAHEDDALRAVRAAVEMRDTLDELNLEFARDWEVTVAIRVGVNTGEVMAGIPTADQSLAVGDAVNLAARLEQMAEPGQILIGEQTRALVGDAVRAEELPPLPVRGKREPVRAWRLLEVMPARSRQLDPNLVGRVSELDQLEGWFRAVVQPGDVRRGHGRGLRGCGQIATYTGISPPSRRPGDGGRGPLRAVRRGGDVLAGQWGHSASGGHRSADRGQPGS